MKGLTLVSTAYTPPYISDRYHILFEMIQAEFGFPIQYTDDPVVPIDVDVLLVALQRTYTHSMMNLEHLNRKVKMIGLLGDIHSLDWKYGNGTKMMTRYDVILSPAREAYEKLYSQFAHKTITFLGFFGAHDRYCSLPIREISQVEVKCLLAGSLTPEWQYSLRVKVAKEGDPKRIVRVFHPGGHPPPQATVSPQVFMGDRFAWLLNRYYCSVLSAYSSGGWMHEPMRRASAKTVEIPAAGSLLLVEPGADNREMGFVPWETMIPVEKENVLEHIYMVLDDPEKYDHVRRAGMEVARENHSVKNRMDTLRGVLANL